ncbi:MAG TPA: two-component system response regulator [Desulfobacteraceae bacterium]|nr:two-component system response regulator [Desulfobacteraceae bacterium]
MTPKNRILIVDDLPANIKVLSGLLRPSYHVSAATSGAEGVAQAASDPKPDLILLDVMMPDMDGYEVCRRLKSNPDTREIPVLFVTAMAEVEEEAYGLSLGAVDYITKPISPSIVEARIRTHLNLYRHKQHLEDLVAERTLQLKSGYIDTIHRLTLASEFKDEETGAHIQRISYYTREVAQALGMDDKFCESIFYASPMHDIGKVAIPDAILLKPGPLDPKEWEVMKTHPGIGAKILDGSDSPYLAMAVDIAHCHHERWDGSGYPQGLKGDGIPLTARIMNLADQYDALRSLRPYKPAFSHEKSKTIITRGDGRTMPGHFDPDLLGVFERISGRFNDIFETHKD